MNYILLFGMPGGAEIIIIILVIIMFFGADKIPEFARTLGKGMKEIKNATNDIQREIKETAAPITDLTDKVDVKKQVTNLIKEETDFAPSSKKNTAKEEEKTDSLKDEVEDAEELKTVPKTVSRKSAYDKVATPTPKEEKE